MNEPKRHHWWPQLQSGRWADQDGLITVIKANGSSFRTHPSNIGLEGELYTRFEFSDQKDLSIERWFSREIETPFVEALSGLESRQIVAFLPLPGRRPEKERELRDLGFVVPTQVEQLNLTSGVGTL